jgi:hypothetical protein
MIFNHLQTRFAFKGMLRLYMNGRKSRPNGGQIMGSLDKVTKKWADKALLFRECFICPKIHL